MKRKDKPEMKRRKRGKSILMKIGNIVIKKFNSVRDAVKSTGLNQSGISSCLVGRYKTTGGYSFEYDIEVIGNIHDVVNYG